MLARVAEPLNGDADVARLPTSLLLEFLNAVISAATSCIVSPNEQSSLRYCIEHSPRCNIRTPSSSFGAPFSELPGDQQTEMLFGLEGEENEFFNLILAHAMQGFYGDPRHGGNRGAASWKMVALPNPPVRGRMPYEN